jgi:4-hydroxy-tetrahydrodipicolinate synthase
MILVCSPHEQTWLANMRDHGQRVYMSSAAPYLYQTPGWQPMRGYTAQAMRGDFAGAQETAATLGPVRAVAGKWLEGRHRQTDNISSIKAWAGLLGMSGGAVRPPLLSLTAPELEELAADLGRAGLLSREDRLRPGSPGLTSPRPGRGRGR